MRGFRSLLVVLLLSLLIPSVASQVCAQQTAAQQTSSGTQAVALNGPWKFRTGDSPKTGASQTPLWAQANYDDSAWQEYTIDPEHSNLTAVQAIQAKELPGWQQHGHPGYTGYAWYRIRLQIAPGTHSLALLMPRHVQDAYEVYVNGTKIGSFGKLDGFRIIYEPKTKVFPIPAIALSDGQPASIAIRVWALRYDGLPSEHNLGGGLRGAPLLGPDALLNVFQQSMEGQTLKTLWPGWLLVALWGSVGIVCLFLFFLSRIHREYLWTGISLTSIAVLVVFEAIAPATNMSSQFSEVMLAASDFIGYLSLPLAAMYLLGVPRPLWRRANSVMAAIILLKNLALLCLFFGLLPPTAVFGGSAHILFLVTLFGEALLLLAIAVDGLRTIGSKAWLPLTPGLLCACGLIVGIIDPLPIEAVGIYYYFYLCVPVSVLIIFLMRFTEQQRENVRLVGDMRQAQTVQQMLIPLTAPQTPGFHVESVYLPASEVGGDFFQVSPGNDGSLLIVVGDVSGKGLKAAMTVSTIVGALRNEPSRQPAEILAHLNRVLHGEIKGFVTCCAASISADGTMIIANAGHIPPYRNGQETPLEGGFPLGIVADGHRPEMRFQLVAGDRLTFLSDGVVEAMSGKRELFGFERTQRISGQSAALIAETAKQFGQEDDITVVGVRYLGIAQMAPVVSTTGVISVAAAG